jgi:hypothetical protein
LGLPILPTKRKKPPKINEWFLLWYLSVRNRWIIGGLALSIVSSFLMLVVRLYTASAIEPWVLGLSCVVGLAIAIGAVHRTNEQLRDVHIELEPFEPNDFEQLLAAIQLPEELRCGGYQLVTGGKAWISSTARNSKRHRRFVAH